MTVKFFFLCIITAKQKPKSNSSISITSLNVSKTSRDSRASLPPTSTSDNDSAEPVTPLASKTNESISQIERKKQANQIRTDYHNEPSNQTIANNINDNDELRIYFDENDDEVFGKLSSEQVLIRKESRPRYVSFNDNQLATTNNNESE